MLGHFGFLCSCVWGACSMYSNGFTQLCSVFCRVILCSLVCSLKKSGENYLCFMIQRWCLPPKRIPMYSIPVVAAVVWILSASWLPWQHLQDVLMLDYFSPASPPLLGLFFLKHGLFSLFFLCTNFIDSVKEVAFILGLRTSGVTSMPRI